MDRALDEVVRERQNNRDRRQRRSTPRGGVRKPSSNSGRNGNGYDESRLWVHDKFDGDENEAPPWRPTDRSDRGAAPRGSSGTKIKVSNLHYELSEDELLDLFRRKGSVLKLDMVYDRAGRSEGTCFVTYAREADADSAVRDFDGANANGQPITVTLVSPPSRGLFDRIKFKNSEEPALKDGRRDPTRKPTPPGIDRYVPPERRRGGGGGGSGGGSGERTHSGPRPAREERVREWGGRRGGRGLETTGGAGGGNVRPKKTVEELDAEMNDYFGGALEETLAAPPTTALVAEDVDMIL